MPNLSHTTWLFWLTPAVRRPSRPATRLSLRTVVTLCLINIAMMIVPPADAQEVQLDYEGFSVWVDCDRSFLFKFVDIFLTAGLNAGGSNGINKVTDLFDSQLQARAKLAKKAGG